MTPAVDTARRVHGAVGFLDLCGFTAWTSREGDVAAVALLHTLRRLVEAACDAHDVEVAKWLGDGVMLIGPDLESVFRTARDIRSAAATHCPLPMRAGVAQGPMMRTADDYVGATVNLAARLCDRAGAGDIRVAVVGGRATLRAVG